MADFSGTEVADQLASGVVPPVEGNDSLGASIEGGGGDFKMRGLADPGPGFVVWVVSGVPDFAGAQAPSAVQAGTVVVADNWR